MQMQKDDATQRKSDVFLVGKGLMQRNAAKFGRAAMHCVQTCHAARPIASHLQHGYLPGIEGK